MTFSRLQRPHRTRAALILTAATTALVSTVVPMGIASAAQHTPAELLQAGAKSIAELDAAEAVASTASTPAQWKESRQHVSDFYFKYYDPILEGPSRGLKSINGAPRKPQMEGYKSAAVIAIRACVEAKPTCSLDVIKRDITVLRDGVARDVLILSGYVNDNDPEATKVAAGQRFLTLLDANNNDTTTLPISQLEKLATQAADGSGAHHGRVYQDPEGSSDAPSLSSQDGDQADSTPVLIVAVIVGVVALTGVIAATAAAGMIPGWTIPELPAILGLPVS